VLKKGYLILINIKLHLPDRGGQVTF